MRVTDYPKEIERAAPAWPYSRSWGYWPSGLLGIILLVVILLVLTGRL